MHRIMVTGSSGIVGSHVLRHLMGSPDVDGIVGVDPVGRHPFAPELADEVPVYPIDVRDQAALLRTLLRHRVTTVLHLAAAQGGWFDMNPVGSFDVNLGGSAFVLEACELAGVDRVLFASSRAVYYGTGETHLVEQRSRPTTPYGLGKFATECLGRALADVGAFEFAALRFADYVCIERLLRPAIRAAGRAEAVNTLIMAGIYGTPIRVRAPAKALVDVVYASELGRLVAALAVKAGRLEHQVYNVGSGPPGQTFEQMIQMCGDRYGDALYALEDHGEDDRRGVLDTARVSGEVDVPALSFPAFLAPLEQEVGAARDRGLLPAAGGAWLQREGVIELREGS